MTASNGKAGLNGNYTLAKKFSDSHNFSCQGISSLTLIRVCETFAFP
jgi:hypothetical protein